MFFREWPYVPYDGGSNHHRNCFLSREKSLVIWGLFSLYEEFMWSKSRAVFECVSRTNAEWLNWLNHVFVLYSNLFSSTDKGYMQKSEILFEHRVLKMVIMCKRNLKKSYLCHLIHTQQVRIGLTQFFLDIRQPQHFGHTSITHKVGVLSFLLGEVSKDWDLCVWSCYFHWCFCRFSSPC